jgi:transcriptional regulator with XRE-family HTH domain
MSNVAATARVGPLLRDWRQRRRLSQLDLALEAGVSARHVSFVETGRSRPSADMVLHLAEQLDVPLRDRNQLLLAAGHAPVFVQHQLDEPEMAPVRAALKRILDGHDPYPAVVVDRAWEMLARNRAVALLTEDVAPELLAPPVNVLRVSLHPDGVAPRILNLAEWRAHLLERLERQIALTGDAALATLLEEVSGYPGPGAGGGNGNGHPPAAGQAIAVPLRVRSSVGELAFISTIATFGTAVEVTASELSIESFFPADEATGDAVRSYVERL